MFKDLFTDEHRTYYDNPVSIIIIDLKVIMKQIY